MRPTLRRIWSSCIDVTKWVGLVLLVGYFWLHPPYISFYWIGIYLALCITTGVIGGLLIIPLIEKVIPSQRLSPPWRPNKVKGGGVWILWRGILLTPGEDGAFCVPLLLVGLTPINAAIFSLVFAAYHYPHYAARYCLGKAVMFFGTSMVVLPHGLGSMVVGHFLQDVLAFGGLHIVGIIQKRQRARNA